MVEQEPERAPPPDVEVPHKKGKGAEPSQAYVQAMEKWRGEPTLRPAQIAAISIIEHARTSNVVSKWPKLEAQQVLEQAIERIQDPFTTNISGPYFCGPTFLMSVMAEKEPSAYATRVVEVLTTARFDGEKVDKDLLNAEPSDSGGSLQVDWMMMSSMRNTHPNMFGEYIGEDDDAYEKGGHRSLLGKLIKASSNQTAGTSVGRMKKDVRSVLGYEIVEAKYFFNEDIIKDSQYPNRFVKKGLPEMIERLPATYDPEEKTICGILIGMGREGSGNSIWRQLAGKKPKDESEAGSDDKGKGDTPEERQAAKDAKPDMGDRLDGLKSLPTAIHWNRIVTKPVLANGEYTFEIFEHGSKRVETWSEEKFNQEVYGYVIAEKRD